MDSKSELESITRPKRYWCSWVCSEDDFRPLTLPPNEKILGWWCSGSGPDGKTLCAVVEGGDETAVADSIRTDWPEFDGEFRFIDETGDARLGDRFPLSGWMTPRFSRSG